MRALDFVAGIDLAGVVLSLVIVGLKWDDLGTFGTFGIGGGMKGTDILRSDPSELAAELALGTRAGGVRWE